MPNSGASAIHPATSGGIVVERLESAGQADGQHARAVQGRDEWIAAVERLA
jgi:hypothetical protein